MIRLLVGLGNPGPEYAATRHNAGFWFVDEAARKLGATLVADRAYSGRVARVNVRGQAIWLLQPTTYMNLSGKSVAPLARFFKIDPAEILVAHDELDLLPGLAKLKLGGGNAGHNGLKDINAQLGSADFWRLRLGIGHPGVKAEVVDYVLRKPPLSERELIDKSIEQSLGALDAMLAGDMAAAGLVIHARPPRPKPPRAAGMPANAAPASDGRALPAAEPTGAASGHSAAPAGAPAATVLDGASERSDNSQ